MVARFEKRWMNIILMSRNHPAGLKKNQTRQTTWLYNNSIYCDIISFFKKFLLIKFSSPSQDLELFHCKMSKIEKLHAFSYLEWQGAKQLTYSKLGANSWSSFGRFTVSSWCGFHMFNQVVHKVGSEKQ